MAKWFDEWTMVPPAIAMAIKVPCFIVTFIITFVVFGTLMNLLSSGFAAFELMANVDFLGKLQIIGNAFLGIFGINKTFLDWLFVFIIVILQSILLGLVVLVWRKRKTETSASNAGNAGIVAGLAILGTGCPTCGTALVMPIVGAIFSSGGYILAGTISWAITIAAIVLALLTLKKVGTEAYVIMKSEQYRAKRRLQVAKKIIRIVVIVLIVGALLTLIILNITSKPSIESQVWDKRATIGNMESKNYYVMYTDFMCPYCSYFSRALADNWEKFKTDYIEGKDILFEVKVTDYFYETMNNQYSRDSAEALYCSRNEDKFWDYYHNALHHLWNDYQSKGYGASKTSPQISNLPEDYWLNIGHEVGLGESFDNCIKNHDTVEEIKKNTAQAAQVIDGLPYFRFNKFTTGGFSDTWGWDYAKKYLDAGLNEK